MTPSGILLNSQILAFSWPNKTTGSLPNPVIALSFLHILILSSSCCGSSRSCYFLQHNRLQPGKRPVSFLAPTVVRPAVGLCGTYAAVGSSNGDKALSAITQVTCDTLTLLRTLGQAVISISVCFIPQVLINVLSLRKNMSDSVAYGRLHPQLQPDLLLVDSECSVRRAALFASQLRRRCAARLPSQCPHVPIF